MYNDEINRGNAAALSIVECLQRHADRHTMITAIREGCDVRLFPTNAQVFVEYALSTTDFNANTYQHLNYIYWTQARQTASTPVVTPDVCAEWCQQVRAGAYARALNNPPKSNGDMTGVLLEQVQRLSALTEGREDEFAMGKKMGTVGHSMVGEWLEKGPSAMGLVTGFKKLDSYNVFRQGEITILLGWTSTGKSMLAGIIAQNVARQGKGVLFYSRDMAMEDQQMRMVWREAQMDRWRIVNHINLPPEKRYSEFQIKQLHEAIDRVARLPLAYYTSKTCNLAEMQAQVARCPVAPSLIIIDHAELYLPLVSRTNDHAAYKLLYSVLNNAFSKVAPNACVMVMHQMNRQITYRENPIPRLTDIEGGGQSPAYSVLGVYRPWEFRHTMKADHAELYGLDKPDWAKSNEVEEWCLVYENDSEEVKAEKKRWKQEQQKKMLLYVLKNREGAKDDKILFETEISKYDIEEAGE
jgi:replicative DNA helicase